MKTILLKIKSENGLSGAVQQNQDFLRGKDVGVELKYDGPGRGRWALHGTVEQVRVYEGGGPCSKVRVKGDAAQVADNITEISSTLALHVAEISRTLALRNDDTNMFFKKIYGLMAWGMVSIVWLYMLDVILGKLL